MNCYEDGEDMSIETFKKALVLEEYVALGGGEPTIHPQFWEMLGLAIGNCEHVWLATNGSQTDISLALAKMAKKGVMGCALSQDAYHDAIDDDVIKAFTKEKKQSQSIFGGEQNNDLREIRDVTGKEINSGRCDFGKDDCVCPEFVVEPDGTIKGCGCADAPTIGNVHDDNICEALEIEGWTNGECYKNQEALRV
jgi:MoaA/NifB/PqqE/SkfB family radical SAM enzyme